MSYAVNTLTQSAIQLLQELIAIPSFSREEDRTAARIQAFLQQYGVPTKRHLNNIWATNQCFSAEKPTLLLNSHHDTVRPNAGYTREPFSPDIVDGVLFGLGSNDAGGPLVSLIATFLYFYHRDDLPWNLILAATAEEEISGQNGIASIISELGKLDCAIVGEPTKMEMAIAEKGLLVLDAIAHGKAGHAARNEGVNALYLALDDIQKIRQYAFPKTSDLLGPVKMTVTVIEAGKQHNVVPDRCQFTIDLRVNELYTLEEALQTVRDLVQSEVTPRSMRIRSSIIPPEHPLVQAGLSLGSTYYGSPTTSDKALLPCPALKMGPGDSARSHTADEYILLSEIENGIQHYIDLLNTFFQA